MNVMQTGPDGKYIAWISDASGEFEIWMQKSDESELPVQITKIRIPIFSTLTGRLTAKKSLLYQKNDLRYVMFNPGK